MAKHKHTVSDSDKSFVIDPITREIKFSGKEDGKKLALMQFDAYSEIFTFEIARTVEGHDMSAVDVVEVHFNNIDGKTQKQSKSSSECTDFNLTGSTFSVKWTVPPEATLYAGKLGFVVAYKCFDELGKASYSFGSDIYTLDVKESINAGETVVIEYADILKQWKEELYNAGYINASTMQKNIADLSTALEVERQRINNLSSLKNGSTTGDAELSDIRIGADGTVYDSAGEAVRGQVDEFATGISTNDDFLNSQLRSFNLNNTETAHIGYYLSTNDEPIAMSESQCYTDYIAVRQGRSYIARHPWGAQFSVSFYDSKKVFIAQQSYTEDTPIDPEKTNDAITTSYWHKITIPKGVSYIRLNLGTSNPLYTMVIEGESSEDIPTEYIPYSPEVHAKEFLNYVSDYAFNNSGILNSEENVRLGVGALPMAEGVSQNVAIGANAMANIEVNAEIDNQSGRYNVAVGNKALQEMTTGNHNTAVGFQAMLGTTTGTANTSVGEDALMSNPAGNFNTVVGCRAMQSATEGDYNTAVGLGAAYWSDESHPTGSRNTMIGAHSGQANGAGSDNVAIGYFAKATNGLNNTIAIGSNARAEKDNQTVIGNYQTKETLVYGDFVISGTDGVKRQIIFNSDGSCSWIKTE